MSDAELNVSLAKLLEWKDCDINRYQRIPNYCNDLNAMREAALSLSAANLHSYARKLCLIKGSNSGLTATARQRAEALYRTLHKA